MHHRRYLTDVDRSTLSGVAAWHALAPLLNPFLPWSAGTLRPAGLVIVLNDVWFRTPDIVVELGSGASTVVLAQLLRELGAGCLLAVERGLDFDVHPAAGIAVGSWPGA